ncbi:MAG TPA: hypothetical protein DEQ02_07340 [Ruminococcaceae bacterium]|nr:hypothetical protein [Oscillospiraceae bacterium]
MVKSISAVTKLNLKNSKLAYLIVGIILATQIIQNNIVKLIMAANGVYSSVDDVIIGAGAYAWLLPVLVAVFIPTLHFRKMMNLGAKRGNFLWGALCAEVILVVAVAIFNTALFYLVDIPMYATGYFPIVANPIELFGWTSHGMVIGFLRQTAFLLLVTSAVHTLTAAQGKWYGFAADIAIVAIISVFTPIAPLREALLWFFNLIIFTSAASWQIAACLILAAGIYALNKPILARKII